MDERAERREAREGRRREEEGAVDGLEALGPEDQTRLQPPQAPDDADEGRLPAARLDGDDAAHELADDLDAVVRPRRRALPHALEPRAEGDLDRDGEQDDAAAADLHLEREPRRPTRKAKLGRVPRLDRSGRSSLGAFSRLPSVEGTHPRVLESAAPPRTAGSAPTRLPTCVEINR